VKTYHVTLQCNVLAKSQLDALDLLTKASEEALKVADVGVHMVAKKVTDE
jgi:hypothetical protein